MVAFPGAVPANAGLRPSRSATPPAEKRIFKWARGRTKTEAQRKLKEIIRDYEDGFVIAAYAHTVADAVRDWLAFGLNGRDPATVEKCTILANTQIIPALT